MSTISELWPAPPSPIPGLAIPSPILGSAPPLRALASSAASYPWIAPPSPGAGPAPPSPSPGQPRRLHARPTAQLRRQKGREVLCGCLPPGATLCILLISAVAPPMLTITATAWGGGGGRIRPPPLGFSKITSSFITVSLKLGTPQPRHQFGVVSCKENLERNFSCYRSNFVRGSLHAAFWADKR